MGTCIARCVSAANGHDWGELLFGLAISVEKPRTEQGSDQHSEPWPNGLNGLHGPKRKAALICGFITPSSDDKDDVRRKEQKNADAVNTWELHG